MAMDEVTIYNMALNAVGTRSNVSLPTEPSREAEVCRIWFEPVRDQVLRAARWSSTKRTARLAQLAERDDTVDWVAGDPSPGFRFAYALPSDYLYPRYLSTFGRFSIELLDGSTRALMTQQEEALLIYTSKQTNIALWNPELQMAIVYALAAHISMPLHGKAKRAEFAMAQANELILQARLNSANESMNEYDSVPEWISARGYAGSAPTVRYLYPHGPMISVAELAGVS